MEEIYVITYDVFDFYGNFLCDLPETNSTHIVCFVETEQEAKDFVASAQLDGTNNLYSYQKIKRGKL